LEPRTISTIEELCDELARGECVSDLAEDFWDNNKGQLEIVCRNWRVLVKAAESSIVYSEISKKLLLHAADAETRDDKGRTALGYAAQLLQPDLVSWLVKNGAQVDRKDGSGRTAFSWVASCVVSSKHVGGSTTLLGSSHLHTTGTRNRLKKCGANLYKPDNDGRTPLSWAAGEGLLDMVEFICLLYDESDDRDKHDALEPDNNGRSPLSFATEMQRGSVISFLISRKIFHEDYDRLNQTPLHWLHRTPRHDQGGYLKQEPEDKKISDLLNYLGFGPRGALYDPDEPEADPNILSQSVKDGKTLLSYALWNDDYGLVETLCARVEGLRSDVPNEDRTPNALMIALEKAKSGVEDQALRKLVSLADCENALQDVLKLGQVDLLAKLLRCLRQDTKHYSTLTRTVLEAFFNHAAPDSAVPLLGAIFKELKPGPDLNETLSSGRMPLEEARDRDRNAEQLVALLLEQGANPGIWTRIEEWDRGSAPQEYCLIRLVRETPDEAGSVSYRFDNTTPEALSKAVAKEKQTIFL
jgi:ankyrin repeat protein